jgi:hypothetical protein
MAEQGLPSSLTQVKCQNPECNKDFEVIMPMPEISNNRFSSSLILIHMMTEQCPFCGVSYEFRLLGIDGYKFKFVPVQRQEDVKIVTPPASKIITP